LLLLHHQHRLKLHQLLHLITGQNPTSAVLVGKSLLEKLK
jgi:hypothetical protein